MFRQTCLARESNVPAAFKLKFIVFLRTEEQPVNVGLPINFLFSQRFSD